MGGGNNFDVLLTLENQNPIAEPGCVGLQQHLPNVEKCNNF